MNPQYSYSLFIGKWRYWHKGHQWLINQRLKQGKNICIAVRDIAPSEEFPHPASWIAAQIRLRMECLGLAHRVKVIIIPDIESVNYGRDVGYSIIEHTPPAKIAEISSTAIRQQLGLP